MRFALILFLTISINSLGQLDTMIVYYNNGQLKKVIPKLDGKPNGNSKMWYESGKLWSEGIWKNGKQIKTIVYHENGTKSYYTKDKKWKTKLKMWHPNGQLWVTSKAQYSKSMEKEFDSTGVLVSKVLEKKGASISCIQNSEPTSSDSTTYMDGSCACSWGNVYWRNGIFVDGRGKDLRSKYSYIRIEYYSNRNKKNETIWNSKSKKQVVYKWGENGTLIKKSDQE